MPCRFLAAKARARDQLGAPMFPPGRVAFLRKLKAKAKAGADDADWDAVWVSNQVRGRAARLGQCHVPSGSEVWSEGGQCI